jgi:inner membrane transporter RhtA
VAGFGIAMAAMNVAFYQAIARIPLGTAVTIEFLGPLAIAVAASRRAREALWIVVAAIGVLALSAPTWGASRTGLCYAVIAAAGWAGYILLSGAVGSQPSELGGLALSVTIAALLTCPFAIPSIPELTGTDIGKVTAAAGLGIALGYALEMQAIRRTSAKVVSVLASLDPALAALAGLVLLRQRLTIANILGIAGVVIAGTGISLTATRKPGPSHRRADQRRPNTAARLYDRPNDPP